MSVALYIDRRGSRRPGYPRLAAFMASDRNFALFKRFGELHSRVLLYKQDELVELEHQLASLDVAEQTPYHLKSRRDDKCLVRKALLAKIDTKLLGYDKALETYCRQHERTRPQKRNIESVARWMEGNKPVTSRESTFLDDWDDLIAPSADHDHGGLDKAVASIGAFLHSCGLPMFLVSSDDARKTTDTHIVMLTTSRVRCISRFLMTSLAVSFLSVPITVLYTIESMSSRLWVLALFTAGFSSSLSLFTKAREYEIFAATAAFCAVMVVFVANLS